MSARTSLFKPSVSGRIVIGGILIVAAVIWLIPVVSAIYNSLKFFGLGNYAYVLTSDLNGVHFLRALLNSFIIAIIAVFLTVSVSALAGFCFSKLSFPGRNALYILTLSLLAIPGVTILAPLFFTMKAIGLNNTHLAVALPEVALTLPFGVLLMRNSFDSIHDEYLHAASIDGASVYQVFFRIYFPLNAGAAINLAILQFVWSFQDFLLPSFLLTRRTLTTATQMINSFNRVQTISPKDIGGFNAGLILLALPVIVVFLVFSSYIKEGLTSGGIKG